MRENSKLSGRFGSGRFELALDARKVAGVLAGSLVLLGLAFVIGSSYGARAGRAPAVGAPKDPLARLDEPIAAAPREDESLRAHEALTAPRAEALPVVKPAAAAVEPLAAPVPLSDPGAESKAAAVAATPHPTPTEISIPPTPAAARTSPPRTAAATSSAASRRASPDRGVTKSKPGPTVASTRHGYTIQLASVAHRADAEKVARRYKGRQARVVAADVPGKGRMWRVQVGTYPTRDAASRGLAALGAQGYITAMR